MMSNQPTGHNSRTSDQPSNPICAQLTWESVPTCAQASNGDQTLAIIVLTLMLNHSISHELIESLSFTVDHHHLNLTVIYL